VVTRTADPTAMQVESLVHEMAFRLVTPEGTVCGVHVVPPSVVARMAASGPDVDRPVATHAFALVQDIPVTFVTVVGSISVVHIPPPSVVTMMLGEFPVKSLTAQHIDVLTQETLVRLRTPDGTDSDVHIAPPSVVPMTEGLPKYENPTAVQSNGEGQSMEFKPLTDVGIA
jgi:hypothetical protein